MKMQAYTTAAACGLVILMGSAKMASATENGLLEYPIGVNTVLPGIQPPPGGTQFVDYAQYYDAYEFVGANGQKAAPGFHANIFADALRLLHTWDFTVGPFAFTSGIVQPIINNNLHVGGTSGSTFGLLDLDLQPVYIDYVNPTHTLFAYAGPDIYVPTGRYDKNKLVNNGLNYYTVAPNGGISWFISPALQASLQVTTEFHTKNNATNYQSGSSIDFDYDVDYNLFPSLPKLFFGIQGYYFQQFTDDTVNGVAVNNGNRGRAFSIGPQIRYDLTGGGIAFKVQPEFLNQNRTEGLRAWVQFSVPVG